MITSLALIYRFLINGDFLEGVRGNRVLNRLELALVISSIP